VFERSPLRLRPLLKMKFERPLLAAAGSGSKNAKFERSPLRLRAKSERSQLRLLPPAGIEQVQPQRAKAQ